MEPATTIIRKLGGPTEVSAALGLHRVRVSNWMRPKEKGGTGGRVPDRHWLKLIAIAGQKNILMSVEDFVRPLADEVSPAEESFPRKPRGQGRAGPKAATS